MEVIGEFSCKVAVIGESLVAPRINEAEGIVYLQNGSYRKSEPLFALPINEVEVVVKVIGESLVALRINEVEIVVCLQSGGCR